MNSKPVRPASVLQFQTDGDFMNRRSTGARNRFDRKRLGAERLSTRWSCWWQPLAGFHICYPSGRAVFVCSHLGARAGGFVCLGSPDNRGQIEEPNLSATISVLTVALIVVVPATFVPERLISEAAKGAIVIQAQVEEGAWRRAIDAHPWIAPIDQWIGTAD